MSSKASGGSSSQVRSTRPNDAPACLSSGASSAEQRRSRAQAATTLPTQSQHQLPMWLAKSLHQRSHVHIELPACYGPTFREGLRSDPSFVNLHNHSEYYFGVGVDLARLCARPPAHAPPAHRPWRPGARALRWAVRAWRCSQARRGAARAAWDSLQQALAGADDDGAERGSAAGPLRRHGQAHAAGAATCAAPARSHHPHGCRRPFACIRFEAHDPHHPAHDSHHPAHPQSSRRGARRRTVLRSGDRARPRWSRRRSSGTSATLPIAGERLQGRSSTRRDDRERQKRQTGRDREGSEGERAGSYVEPDVQSPPSNAPFVDAVHDDPGCCVVGCVGYSICMFTDLASCCAG